MKPYSDYWGPSISSFSGVPLKASDLEGLVVDTRTVCACCSSCTCAVRIDHQWTCATYFGSSKTSVLSACLLAFIDTSVCHVFNWVSNTGARIRAAGLIVFRRLGEVWGLGV